MPTLANRDVLTVEDLCNEEVEAIFSLADEMSLSIRQQSEVCKGHIMATLFFEPSTRTRLSFESAMHRLGGRVIGFADVRTSSVSKGESIADTARIVSAYADIIVVRHPWEGAAKVLADYASVPVINAGDGGHEHPSQTLCDLYTLKKEKGSIKGTTVVLWGDLKYGRAVHSLAYGLAKFGARIMCFPIPGLEMPAHVIRRIQQEHDCELIVLQAQDIRSLGDKVDVIYLTPPPQQLSLLSANSEPARPGKLPRIDALYMTRVQKERFDDAGNGKLADSPPIDIDFLKKSIFKDAVVMHPLPRVDEIDHSVDSYHKSVYFQQAARGVPIRMALTALVLGTREMPGGNKTSSRRRNAFDRYSKAFGVACPNSSCVSNQEKRYLPASFVKLKGRPLTLRCEYCEREIAPPYIAGSRVHHGPVEDRKYYRADSFMLDRIKPEHLIVFGSETAAREQGFNPGKMTRIEDNDRALPDQV